jgi:ubiquinone/menaquinone biosynthesis C-methylase UbiE
MEDSAPNPPLTRWEHFFAHDPSLFSVPPSQCAALAAERFLDRGIQTVLDLGCGVGRDTVFLAQKGLRVIGIDAARSGLRSALQKLKNRDLALTDEIIYIQADGRSLPLDTRSIPAVYCFGLLHEFVGDQASENVRRVLAEIERVLQPEGILVLAVLSGEPEKGLPQVQLFTEAMLDQALQCFTCLEKREYEDIGCTGRTNYRVWMGVYGLPGNQA